MKNVKWDVVKDVDSSFINRVWYSNADRVLVIEMLGGRKAGYAGVSPFTVQGLMNAASAGNFYNTYVKTAGYGGVNTDELTYEVPNRTPGLTGAEWKPTERPVRKTRFRVEGSVLRPTTVSEVLEADSLEDAIAEFRKKFSSDKPTVKSVVTL